MIVFWLICIAMTAIALAFVMPPLWQRNSTATSHNDKEANVAVYRDQMKELETDRDNGIISAEQYAIERDEIERRLLEDVGASRAQREDQSLPARGKHFAYAVALAIPLLAVGLYFRIGNPQAITASTSMPARNVPAGSGQRSQEAIQANVDALAKRLEQNPSDVSGWKMLGRSYLNLENYQGAAAAYARAAALQPDDADLLADYAFSLGMANGQRLRGQPQELIERALKLEPENPKALELAGTAAYEVKNYAAAVAYWERLLQKSSDSELTNVLKERINRARAMQSAGSK
ncbi:MAG TPA: c-type cytochrome biogenesis protein CcmI [Pyrinomonadaceae bacterium]|nr:c-type cytochrome biogenesis protein CcmI [Pyrinomonadaceae bacterium]